MKHTNLQKDINMLIENFSKSLTIPKYKEIKIFVNTPDSCQLSPDGRFIVNKEKIFSVQDYSQEYDGRKSGLPWINLQCAGILENTLIVIIEYPTKNDNYDGVTSVNFSGPYNDISSGLPEWDFKKRYIIST